MEKLPGALVVVDVQRERIAVREAKKLGIPTVCLIDTDSDPDFADIPIPGNDDAIRSIEVIIGHLADAVEAGRRAIPAEVPEAASRRRRSARPTTARAEEDRAAVPETDIQANIAIVESADDADAGGRPAVPDSPEEPDLTAELGEAPDEEAAPETPVRSRV